MRNVRRGGGVLGRFGIYLGMWVVGADSRWRGNDERRMYVGG
jgi:hypothetical protein